jgi:hypothetical protein
VAFESVYEDGEEEGVFVDSRITSGEEMRKWWRYGHVIAEIWKVVEFKMYMYVALTCKRYPQTLACEKEDEYQASYHSTIFLI